MYTCPCLQVSYLMAMEKSKCTPAARASKKIVLPDPSVRWVAAADPAPAPAPAPNPAPAPAPTPNPAPTFARYPGPVKFETKRTPLS